MKKGLIIFLLAIMSWFSAFGYRGSCSPADLESGCACKARIQEAKELEEKKKAGRIP